MMGSQLPNKGSGRTLDFVDGDTILMDLTPEEERVACFIFQIPSTGQDRVFALNYGPKPDGGDIPDPTLTSPGSPRMMGAGVWAIDFYGNQIKLTLVAGGADVDGCEVFFSTTIRAQEARVSSNSI
jgi:hypothetical protein